MDSRPIGVFDSGIGGLTVVKEIIKQLPNENIIYLGDTARVPYGTRGKDVIEQFALELAKYLIKKDVKFLVVSCNTISANCLEVIEKISPVPVLGVIDPAVEEALKITSNKRIGVIGTQATISSGVYEKELKNKDPKVKVYSQSGSLFVPLIEEGFSNSEAARQIARQYLSWFDGTNVDTLILGCTHFPLMNQIIQEVMGPDVTLIDSAKPTARVLKKILEEKHLEKAKSMPKYEILVTDAPDRVYEVSQRFFKNRLPVAPKKVVL